MSETLSMTLTDSEIRTLIKHGNPKLRDFATAQPEGAIRVYQRLHTQTDFPKLEFIVLVLWSPEFDPETGKLVTEDSSMTTREIAKHLYPDREEVDINKAMNTVRGKKGSIRNRFQKTRHTLNLAKGEAELDATR